jgi:hypothetical protein
MSSLAEVEAQALSVVTSFLEMNYSCECGSDPECPGEVFEAHVLLEALRPVLHRERDLQLAAAAAPVDSPHLQG